jgi:hypothetical protein
VPFQGLHRKPGRCIAAKRDDISFSLYESITSNDFGRAKKPCRNRGFDNIFHVGGVENAR